MVKLPASAQSYWTTLTNIENSANELKGPIMAHHPTVQPLLPTTVTMSDVLAPSILTNIPYHAAGPISSEETQETLYDVLEYLDMLSLASPRVQTTDQVDPFISRYEVPGLSERVDNGSTDKTGQAVRVVKWAGLIPIQWVLELLCAVMCAPSSYLPEVRASTDRA